MKRDSAGTRDLAPLDPRRLLAYTRTYGLTQRLLAPTSAYQSFVVDHVQAADGDRVLDIGCGPAHDLMFMPDVSYVGFDLNPRYIESAEARWRDTARFFCAEVSRELLDGEEFEIVIANGVLHHLDGEGANELMDLAANVLVPGGRLITKDPVRLPNQRLIATVVMNRDRGEHIRTAEGYRALAEHRFASVNVTIQSNWLRIPYDHAVLECSAGSASH